MTGFNSYLLACSHASPPFSYNQEEIFNYIGSYNAHFRKIFLNGKINRRHIAVDIRPVVNNLDYDAEQHKHHEKNSIALSIEAVTSCLEKAGKEASEIKYICCVTSTGLMLPGLSARLIHDMHLSEGCGRADVVGMGCSAGINGLDIVRNWSICNPGKVAMLVCVEICSANYFNDGSIESATVNSLFGDGASAALVIGGEKNDVAARPLTISLLAKKSITLSSGIGMMKLEWQESQKRHKFVLSREISHIIECEMGAFVTSFLADHQLRIEEISHWVVHSGGKRIIDAIISSLRLDEHDLRHTISVLNDYGNVSSGSFLISLERLQNEDVCKKGDIGLFVTMGPGITIEVMLVSWI